MREIRQSKIVSERIPNMGVDLKSANGKGVFLVEVTYRQNGAIVILIDIFLRFRK